MQSFSIRQIELLTGIKSHTLRIWEQRYDFFKAPRKESNLRFYTNEDLKKLLCISFLYHNGWKVSRIAALSDEEVAAEVERIPLGKENYPTAIQHLLKAAIDFNEAGFTAVLSDLQPKIGFEALISEVCYPYLNRVGLLWDTSKIIPAQEHFSSYIIQARVISETEKLSPTQNGEPEIVLFCPEEEFHELPLLFINYLLRKHGWRVLYLGPNIRLKDLEEAARLPGISHLYLHLITNFTGISIDEYFETLRRAFPDKIIVASGRSLEQSQRNFVNLHLLRRDEDIYNFVEKREWSAGNGQ
jgi:MerR family transcriptional regulator, light-induced transcriptional regulator